MSEFSRRYRSKGQGEAAFDPELMVALVFYAQAVGVRSSRSIERACTCDAGFKVITGQLVPDHSTITRFLKAVSEPPQRRTADNPARFTQQARSFALNRGALAAVGGKSARSG